MNTKIKTLQRFTVIAAVFVSVTFLATQSAHAQTVVNSRSISTGSIVLDASTIPTNSTAGVVQLNVKASGDNVVGQNTNLIIQGDYGGFGTKTTITSGADMVGQTKQFGNVVYLVGRSTGVASEGFYVGNAVISQGSTSNASNYIGNYIAFDQLDGALDMANTGEVTGYGTRIMKTGTGTVRAFEGDVTKTSATGDVTGLRLEVRNQTVAADRLEGISLNVDVSGNPGQSNGISLYENGASGTLQKGIVIGSTRNTGTAPYGVTTGIDVSDYDIQYAMDVGQNTIKAEGSFSIDLNIDHDDTLTITNSDPGHIASLAVEGGVTIGNSGVNPGTPILKHYSTSFGYNFSAPGTVPGCMDSATTTVNGANLGDTVVVSTMGLPTNYMINGYVAAANAVVVRLCQIAGSATDPDGAGGTYRVDVWQH